MIKLIAGIKTACCVLIMAIIKSWLSAKQAVQSMFFFRTRIILIVSAQQPSR